MKNENQMVVRNMDDAVRAGKVLAESQYFKDVKNVAQAIAKIMAGVELGIPPMAAMTGVHIIDGKAALGSNLIASQIQRSGRFKYRIKEQNAKVCKIEFFELEGEKWESLGVSEFTFEMGKRAGLTDRGQNWKKYPEAMLFARALTQGARLFTPAVFGAPIYTPEELGDESAEVIDAPVVVVTDQVKETVKNVPEIKEPAPAPKAKPLDAPTEDPELISSEQIAEIEELILDLPEQEAKAILVGLENWTPKKFADYKPRIIARVKEFKSYAKPQTA